MNKVFTNIDEYINSFPSEVQDKLRLVRQIIKDNAPEAKESISWQMPTFKLNGNLIHFACHRHHIGLYPGPDAIIEFKDKLKKYKTSKGAIQLPLDEEIPIPLIKEIVKYRVKVNTTLTHK